MMDRLETAAFLAYRVFIRDANGTRRSVHLSGGNSREETHEEASLRRWNAAPQSTRDEFMAYAKVMEPVLSKEEF